MTNNTNRPTAHPEYLLPDVDDRVTDLVAAIDEAIPEMIDYPSLPDPDENFDGYDSAESLAMAMAIRLVLRAYLGSDPAETDTMTMQRLHRIMHHE